MEIDWLPLSLSSGIFFWITFVLLGLLMPFFVLINTFTLGRILQELKKINRHFDLLRGRGNPEDFRHQNRRSDD
mgnify:CR=1 FL=1|tara:strand:+ start:1423 stop:1644 length:222 start_codon:yes stop_codon:yes gene_type:complete